MTGVQGTQGRKQTEKLIMCMHKALGKCCHKRTADFSLDLHATYSGVQLRISFFVDSPQSTLRSSLSNL